MAVDDKEVKAFEDTYKKILFDKIRDVISKQAELILQIQQIGKSAGLDTDLTNIGITLNNKLVQLQNQFKAAGISMHSTVIEDFDELNVDPIMSSFLGEAIISDLIDYIVKGSQALNRYSESISDISKQKTNKVQELERVSALRKFFVRLRSFFIPMKEETGTLAQEEIAMLNTFLSDYRDIDNQLYKYNLRDNIVDSIIRQIRRQSYDADTSQGLLEEFVIPDLKKLGLADLIPDLQSALSREYKKDLPDFNKTDNNSVEMTPEESQYQAQPTIDQGFEPDEK